MNFTWSIKDDLENIPGDPLRVIPAIKTNPDSFEWLFKYFTVSKVYIAPVQGRGHVRKLGLHQRLVLSSILEILVYLLGY